MFKEFLTSPSSIALIGAVLVALGAFWSASQSHKFETEVKQKNEEIKKLNEYILSTVTGGNSFCVLNFLIDTSKNIRLAIVQKGEYPVYEVQMRIVDLQKLEKEDLSNLTLEKVLENDIIKNIGNVSPGSSYILGNVQFGKETRRDFNIFFMARNGAFTQLQRFRLVNDKWVSACRVIRNNEIIYEKVDLEFPINQYGTVNWDD